MQRALFSTSHVSADSAGATTGPAAETPPACLPEGCAARRPAACRRGDPPPLFPGFARIELHKIIIAPDASATYHFLPREAAPPPAPLDHSLDRLPFSPLQTPDGRRRIKGSRTSPRGPGPRRVRLSRAAWGAGFAGGIASPSTTAPVGYSVRTAPGRLLSSVSPVGEKGAGGAAVWVHPGECPVSNPVRNKQRLGTRLHQLQRWVF